MNRLPVWFISHGGGPWPWVGGMREAHGGLEAALREIPRASGSPKAVLVATAHWEEEAFTFSSGAAPGMIHDYGGFPAHTYQVRYPAPGAPDLAAHAADLLARRGLAARLDADRGFDHGTFVPLHVMWPDADVPVVQMSMRRDLDPAAHLEAGEALAELRDAGVLVVGSGLSYHNLGRLGPAGRASSATFDSWLQETVTASGATDRAQRLEAWATAPMARVAHPREEHLLPLHIAVGAAGADPGTCAYREEEVLGGWTVANFRFG